MLENGIKKPIETTKKVEKKDNKIPEERKTNLENINSLLLDDFIKSRIIFLRHLEYNKNEGIDGSLSEIGIKNANDISKKISDYIGKTGNYNLYFSDCTKRVEETVGILMKNNTFLQKFSKTPGLATREKNNTTNLATSLTKVITKTLDFLNDLFDKNQDAICVIHRTNVGVIFDYFNDKEGDRIYEYTKMKEGESLIIDINKNGDIIDYKNNNILHILPINLTDILEEFKNDENIGKLIKQFIYKKIDSKYLQNSINYTFKKYNLYEKYLFSDNKEISDFCFKNIDFSKNFKLEEYVNFKLSNTSFEDLSNFFKTLTNNINIKEISKILKNYTFFNFTSEGDKELYLMFHLLEKKPDVKIFDIYKKILDISTKQKAILLDFISLKPDYEGKTKEVFENIIDDEKSFVKYYLNAKKIGNQELINEINNNIITYLINFINKSIEISPDLNQKFYIYLNEKKSDRDIYMINMLKSSDYYKKNSPFLLKVFKTVSNIGTSNKKILDLFKGIGGVLFDKKTEELDLVKGLGVDFNIKGVLGGEENYNKAIFLCFENPKFKILFDNAIKNIKLFTNKEDFTKKINNYIYKTPNLFNTIKSKLKIEDGELQVLIDEYFENIFKLIK